MDPDANWIRTFVVRESESTQIKIEKNSTETHNFTVIIQDFFSFFLSKIDNVMVWKGSDQDPKWGTHSTDSITVSVSSINALPGVTDLLEVLHMGDEHGA